MPASESVTITGDTVSLQDPLLLDSSLHSPQSDKKLSEPSTLLFLPFFSLSTAAAAAIPLDIFSLLRIELHQAAQSEPHALCLQYEVELVDNIPSSSLSSKR
jgi:hypothetical protein